VGGKRAAALGRLAGGVEGGRQVGARGGGGVEVGRQEVGRVVVGSRWGGRR